MQQGYRQQSGQRAPQQRTEVARREPETIVLASCWSNAEAATNHFAELARCAHLITPATTVAHVPDGHRITTSVVDINPEMDTYPNKGGKLALSKSALDRIAAALGISWVRSERIDDRSHPWLVEWEVVGTYRQLDGNEVSLVGNIGIDLRDGSAETEDIYATAKPGTDPEATIRARRSKIREHAESKARLRAIRSVGVKASYTPKELERPFVVAKLSFTGDYADKETNRAVALLRAQAHVGGLAALYGGAAARRALPPPPQALALPTVAEDDAPGDDDFTAGAPHHDARVPMHSESTPQRAQPARDERPRPSPQPARGGGTGLTIPFGRSKGTPIEDATDDDLIYLRDHIAGKFEAGDVNPRFEAENRRLLEGVKAELAARDEGDDR